MPSPIASASSSRDAPATAGGPDEAESDFESVLDAFDLVQPAAADRPAACALRCGGRETLPRGRPPAAETVRNRVPQRAQPIPPSSAAQWSNTVLADALAFVRSGSIPMADVLVPQPSSPESERHIAVASAAPFLGDRRTLFSPPPPPPPPPPPDESDGEDESGTLARTGPFSLYATGAALAA